MEKEEERKMELKTNIMINEPGQQHGYLRSVE